MVALILVLSLKINNMCELCREKQKILDWQEEADIRKQEREKEREKLIKWLEKQDWECYEQIEIKKDIFKHLKA